MLYKTLSAAVYGIDANLVEVEVDVAPVKSDKDYFTTVGLPDTTVRESRYLLSPVGGRALPCMLYKTLSAARSTASTRTWLRLRSMSRR